MRRVFQHNSRQVARGVCAENVPGIPLLHEVGEIAAVIDVRMTQDSDIHLGGVKREIRIPIIGFRPAALVQAALEQNSLLIHLQQEHGTRRGACGPAELDLHYALLHEFANESRFDWKTGRITLLKGP